MSSWKMNTSRARFSRERTNSTTPHGAGKRRSSFQSDRLFTVLRCALLLVNLRARFIWNAEINRVRFPPFQFKMSCIAGSKRASARRRRGFVVRPCVRAVAGRFAPPLPASNFEVGNGHAGTPASSRPPRNYPQRRALFRNRARSMSSLCPSCSCRSGRAFSFATARLAERHVSSRNRDGVLENLRVVAEPRGGGPGVRWCRRLDVGVVRRCTEGISPTRDRCYNALVLGDFDRNGGVVQGQC